jgi:uncharacterized protein (DUF849 family)
MIACAVTGSADTPGRNPAVPVTPAQIAASAIDAAKAGAAIVHIHVRDPQTTKPSMDAALYREVVERIRSSGTDVLINLTTGPGARFIPGADEPLKAAPGSTLSLPAARVRHVVELKPEICSLDMGSMNMGGQVFVNTPAHLEAMATEIRDAGVAPELEVFEAGHLMLARRLIETGHVSSRSASGFPGDSRPRRKRSPICAACCPAIASGSPSAFHCTNSPSPRKLCCSAAMCGSGWRTISISRRAS